MKPIVDIGLPDLSEEEMANLAEECEETVTEFLLGKVPAKSIDELHIICSIAVEDILELEIDIEIAQKYETDIDLDVIIHDAQEYGADWLENRLREMKSD